MIVEREVNFDSLSKTFITGIFGPKDWSLLLNGFGHVCDDLVREFYANAIACDGFLDCWVRGKEFTVSPASLSNLLRIHPVEIESTVPYPERRDKIDDVVVALGGYMLDQIKTMHTSTFKIEVRTLAYIMIYNLYPVKNLSTLNQGRTLFLYDLYLKKNINICEHIFYLMDASVRKKEQRMTLSFCSLIMKILRYNGVTIPIGWTPLYREDPISMDTMFRSRARLPGAVKQAKKKQKQEPFTIVDKDIEEKVDHFTLGEETVPPFSVPSSSQPDYSDCFYQLFIKMDEMQGSINNLHHYSQQQFTYLQEQITHMNDRLKNLGIDDLARD